MELIKAEPKDFEGIKLFYQEIIEQTKDMDQYARWKTGLHPTDAGMKQYIEEGAMYLLLDGDQIAGAMAVTMEQGEDYHAITWDVHAQDDEVAVLHILGVHPSYQKKGLGKQLIEEYLKLAQQNHKKALRLDALASNTPAQQMYLSKGFSYKGKQHLFAENTGWTDFYFYEYSVKKP